MLYDYVGRHVSIAVSRALVVVSFRFLRAMVVVHPSHALHRVGHVGLASDGRLERTVVVCSCVRGNLGGVLGWPAAPLGMRPVRSEPHQAPLHASGCNRRRRHHGLRRGFGICGEPSTCSWAGVARGSGDDLLSGASARAAGCLGMVWYPLVVARLDGQRVGVFARDIAYRAAGGGIRRIPHPSWVSETPPCGACCRAPDDSPSSGRSTGRWAVGHALAQRAAHALGHFDGREALMATGALWIAPRYTGPSGSRSSLPVAHGTTGCGWP